MKYTHPILKRNAEDIQEYNRDSKHPYRIIVGDGLDGKDGIRYSKDELLALGFQPVEETKTDWIDDAYEEGQHTVTSNDIKYFYRDEFRQVIEKHQPKSDVCNLVPLDTKKIDDELQPLSFQDSDGYACTSISNMLSILHKYGTTPQKKFTQDEILKYINDRYGERGNMIRFGEFHSFLRNNNLLED